MRLAESRHVEAGKSNIKRIDSIQKINWPDMVFGPVNLWCLPPASFFYRKRSDNGFI